MLSNEPTKPNLIKSFSNFNNYSSSNETHSFLSNSFEALFSNWKQSFFLFLSFSFFIFLLIIVCRFYSHLQGPSLVFTFEICSRLKAKSRKPAKNLQQVCSFARSSPSSSPVRTTTTTTEKAASRPPTTQRTASIYPPSISITTKALPRAHMSVCDLVVSILSLCNKRPSHH